MTRHASESWQARVRSGHVEQGEIEALLGRLLREVDLYGVYLRNLLGSLDRKARLPVMRKPVDLISLVRSVVDLFETAAQKKGVDIKFDTSEQIARVPLDHQLTQRLLINVIENAIKYSYSTSQHGVPRFITVRVRRHNPRGDYAVRVESYGVGILEEELEGGAIFRYGVRGKLASGERVGTGIGLAEAKRIAEAHEGHIQIRSTPAGSAFLTTVTVIFPCHRGI